MPALKSDTITNNFILRFIYPGLKETRMVKLDDNIYYASIKIRGHFTELKYKFIKICLNSEFDEEETSEYDK